MVKSWLAYLLTLGCGGAFYLFYPGQLSFYTLILLLVLPFLSLGLTLLSLRRLTLDVSSSCGDVARGGAASARLALRGPKTAAGASARLRFRLENRLYPQLTEEKALTLSCNTPQVLDLPTDHCGWLSLTVLSCALTDWLGLFPIRVKPSAPVLVLVCPRPNAARISIDLTPAQGRPLRPRPGGGPGEDYELRPYRPGDPVTSIHWKLTAKQPQGDPILRETMEPLEETLAVTYDHFGDPDDVDALLDRLEGLERQLMDAERPFTLCWADPDNGQLTPYQVDCPDAWQRCYRVLASAPAPLTGQGLPIDQPLTLPGCGGPVRRIHLALPSSRPNKEVTP